MPTVTANQIAAFRSDSLEIADAKSIRVFLLKVAETLKEADRSKIQSGFLREVSVLVFSLRKKMFASGKRYPKTAEMLYADIKGLMLALEQSEEDGKFDRQYFREVYELGMLLEDLAAVVKALTPLLITLQGINLN